jgi:ketosteroid isomerase-like protein
MSRSLPAIAWSSNDAEMLLPLFTDNIVYEDVTFGAVNQGKTTLRDFATATFGAFADLKFELKSRMVAADGNSGCGAQKYGLLAQ